MEGIQTLKGSWPWPWIRHTVVHHSSTSIYIPNFIQIEETFCGRTDGRTDGHFPPSNIIRSTFGSRPKNVELLQFQASPRTGPERVGPPLDDFLPQMPITNQPHTQTDRQTDTRRWPQDLAAYGAQVTSRTTHKHRAGRPKPGSFARYTIASIRHVMATSN